MGGLALAALGPTAQGPLSVSLVSARTQLVGVFAHPVGHSHSPAMHNAAFAALGLDWLYLPFDVPPARLGDALRALPALGLRGVNLTIPHKQSAISLVDEVAPGAVAAGAINTVVCEDGRLVGHNTDGDGFLRPLKEEGLCPAGKRAVLLGAGGAARAIAVSLLGAGVSALCIANRTASRAQQLAQLLAGAAPAGVRLRGLPLDSPDVRAALQDADLLVNSTSVGMYPRAQSPPPVREDWLHPGLFVYDIVYNPLETRLLRAARGQGCATLNGVRMLVGQGALAFELWTGMRAPASLMEQALLGSLAAAG